MIKRTKVTQLEAKASARNVLHVHYDGRQGENVINFSLSLSLPHFLAMSLYACIVDVAIMAFIKDNLWCALFLYEML